MDDDFGRRLVKWYKIYKRDLPWRDTNDAYKIWLSEVILQQTRVDQGLAYYYKFISKYPDVESLARAQSDAVFKLWQGLGYYNRAANMLEAAKTIANDFSGKFPESAVELQKIKGIGPYTSAAIASIVFHEAVPVLDGNVSRVLSRIFGIDDPIDKSEGKKKITELSLKLMADLDPGNYNQALMEFGALHCKPKKPDCHNCIFQNSCYAFKLDVIDKFPVKKPKPKVRKRYIYYFLLEVMNENSAIYMKKRTAKDIWKNLYDFPSEEFTETADIGDLMETSTFVNALGGEKYTVANVSEVYIHKLSHQQIHATFIRLIVDKKLHLPIVNSLTLVDKNKIVEYPVPRLIDRYLREQQIIKTHDRIE